MRKQVPATPYPFPYSARLDRENTVILVIDMQIDFCGEDGYMHRLGGDLSLLRAPIEPIRRVLETARPLGYRVVYTREGYGQDLADLQPWKRRRVATGSVQIGDPGPLGRALVRGEACWDLLPEMKPAAGEQVFDKAGYGVFAFTDVDNVLRNWGIENVVLTGVTTDCCVHSVLREALDRGYDCLVLEDCVGASHRIYHDAALTLMRKASGVFGTVSDSQAFIDVVSRSVETR